MKFSLPHIVVSEIEGNFKGFYCNVTSPNVDFQDAKIDFTVQIGTINIYNEQCNTHLKGIDLFNVNKFPEM